jgi:hypothetical protein
MAEKQNEKERIGALRWTRLEDQLRPTRSEESSALLTGFLWTWTKWERYSVDEKTNLISGEGERTTYYPAAQGRALVESFETVHDRGTLEEFVNRFGLLGCGEKLRGDESHGPGWCGGDSIDLCLVHAWTIRTIRKLSAEFNQAMRGGKQDRDRLAASLKDWNNNRLAMGDSRVGNILVDWRRVEDKPLVQARDLLQYFVNANTEGIRPFLYVRRFLGGRPATRTWLSFAYLYELIYWQVGQELLEDRSRQCRRIDCGKIFKARHRKQIYCSRRCLDIDKQARYAQRVRSSRPRQKSRGTRRRK